ncbi:MAG: DUF3040 domain-containing protein [Actinomadura sp.]
MSLPLHESRVLALIEADLCRADPELAARFAMFNRLAAEGAPPREEEAGHGRRPWRVVAAAVLVAVLILVMVAVVAPL